MQPVGPQPGGQAPCAHPPSPHLPCPPWQLDEVEALIGRLRAIPSGATLDARTLRDLPNVASRALTFGHDVQLTVGGPLTMVVRGSGCR